MDEPWMCVPLGSCHGPSILACKVGGGTGQMTSVVCDGVEWGACEEVVKGASRKHD